MKAVIAPKKDHDNRLRLEQVIPIETPFSLFVELSDEKLKDIWNVCVGGDANEEAA